jgi:hypothetical protein
MVAPELHVSRIGHQTSLRRTPGPLSRIVGENWAATDGRATDGRCRGVAQICDSWRRVASLFDRKRWHFSENHTILRSKSIVETPERPKIQLPQAVSHGVPSARK